MKMCLIFFFCVFNVSYLYVTACLFVFQEMKDANVSYFNFIHVLNVAYLYKIK